MAAKTAKKVLMIPANPKFDSSIKLAERSLRVAAYCRVSTELEEQESSYEAQVEYYTKKINENPNWKNAGIYADDSKSATNTKKRDDFRAMITGMVICGKCGHEYRRVTWAKKGKKKIVWRCLSRLESGTRKCSESPSIEESLLQNAVMKAIQQIAAGNGDFVGAFRQNVIRVIGNYGKTDEKDEYDDMIKEKQDEMVALITENAKAGEYNEWFDKRYKTIADEITELKEKQLETRRRKKLVESYDERVKDMDEFLQNASQVLLEFDNDLVRRLIESIKVISADEIMIQFKSGIVMKQKINEEW